MIALLRTPHIFAALFERKKALCGRGEIGRRARLRIWCREAWGFESLRPHSKNGVLMIFDEQLPFLSSHQFTFFVFK
jgi:hypothetical protein